MVNPFKYLLSFLVDVPIEKTESILNPELNIVIRNGKLLLNSTNANYSYGSLQEAFRFAFKKHKIDSKKINSTLILGFGCGSIAAVLSNELNIHTEITGVEADEKVLELYSKYFVENISNDLTLVEAFAEEFLQENKETYDLIIIDVFLDLIVPAPIQTRNFLDMINNCLNKGGLVYYNMVVMDDSALKEFESLKKIFLALFKKIEVIEFMNFNKIIIAKKE